MLHALGAKYQALPSGRTQLQPYGICYSDPAVVAELNSGAFDFLCVSPVRSPVSPHVWGSAASLVSDLSADCLERGAYVVLAHDHIYFGLFFFFQWKSHSMNQGFCLVFAFLHGTSIPAWSLT